MDWDEAKKHLSKGKSVRRDVWISSIRQDFKVLIWNITDEVAKGCNYSGARIDKTYDPTVIDLHSKDWRLA